MSDWQSRVYRPAGGMDLPKEWGDLRKKVIERDECCQGCGKRRDLTVHHIVPRSKGGSNRLGNLIALCTECHDKVELHIDDFPDRRSIEGAFHVMRVRRVAPVGKTWQEIVYGGKRYGYQG